MNLFLDHFIDVSIKRLQAFEPPEGYYLAFSGGKDSCVVKWLADKAGVKYTAHYNVTTIDPPEIIRFIRAEHPEVHWNYPRESFFQMMIRKHFPPLRKQRYCCELLKEVNGMGRRIISGVRTGESSGRANRKMVENCYKDPTTKYVHPIYDWPDHLVWECIRKNKIPYCSLYDEGFTRLGCIMCPMATKSRRLAERDRWPRMERAFRKTFQKIWDKRIEVGKDNKHDNADDWFDWWINL